MQIDFFQLLDTIIKHFSDGEYYDLMSKAKAIYFSLTGKADEDAPDFENRMKLFNDWYIFQFKETKNSETLIKKYLKDHTLNEEMAKALASVQFGLFDFQGTSLLGKMTLKEYVTNSKFYLAKDHPNIGLMKGEILIGRIAQVGDENYLLPGLTVVPMEAKSILRKAVKKIRKEEPEGTGESFLMKVEQLNNKYRQYTHVDINKIFTF